MSIDTTNSMLSVSIKQQVTSSWIVAYDFIKHNVRFLFREKIDYDSNLRMFFVCDLKANFVLGTK